MAGRWSTATDNFTIEAVVKPSTTIQTALIAYNGNDAGGWGMGHSAGSNMGSGTHLNALYGGVAAIDGSFVFPNTTTWHHLIVTRESGTTKFYADGVAQAGTSASIPGAPNNAAEIAHEPAQAARFWAGSIAYVVIRNVALSAANAATEYSLMKAIMAARGISI